MYAEIIEGIRTRLPDVVVCASCSGRVVPEFEKRSEVLELEGAAKPDMASLTLSSMNFAREASLNPPDTVQHLARKMLDRGIKPELEVFDLGMINYAKYLISRGYLEPPFYFNIILGNVSTAQADPLHLGVMLNSLPERSIWAVGGIGLAQLPMTAVSIALGGGVRIGLEDNIWYDQRRTRLATNRDIVERTVALGRLMGRKVMDSSELRRVLGLSIPLGVR